MDKKEALEFIKKNKLCVLATCSENKPEAATMSYVTDGEVFYFGTSPNSRKASNIRKNKNVAIVVGVSKNQPSIQINGEAERITDEKEKEKHKNLIKEKSPEYLKYFEDPNIFTFKVKPIEFWYEGKRL